MGVVYVGQRREGGREGGRDEGREEGRREGGRERGEGGGREGEGRDRAPFKSLGTRFLPCTTVSSITPVPGGKGGVRGGIGGAGR